MRILKRYGRIITTGRRKPECLRFYWIYFSLCNFKESRNLMKNNKANVATKNNRNAKSNRLPLARFIKTRHFYQCLWLLARKINSKNSSYIVTLQKTHTEHTNHSETAKATYNRIALGRDTAHAITSAFAACVAVRAVLTGLQRSTVLLLQPRSSEPVLHKQNATASNAAKVLHDVRTISRNLAAFVFFTRFVLICWRWPRLRWLLPGAEKKVICCHKPPKLWTVVDKRGRGFVVCLFVQSDNRHSIPAEPRGCRGSNYAYAWCAWFLWRCAC